jgi:hypothetical protein
MLNFNIRDAGEIGYRCEFLCFVKLNAFQRDFENDGEIVRFVFGLLDDHRVIRLLPCDFFLAAQQVDFFDGSVQQLRLCAQGRNVHSVGRPTA